MKYPFYPSPYSLKIDSIGSNHCGFSFSPVLCSLSTSPLQAAAAPRSAISSGIDPQILAGGSSIGRAGPLAARVQRAGGGGAPAGGSCPWRSCRGGGLQPACRRRGRATCRGVRCHNPETTGGEEDNRLSPDKFSRCRRRDRRDVRWSRHRRQG